MGYFVQISTENGTIVFQLAKNYPEVSFASSALFHALVTASLEQSFVPGVLRADDAAVALAVHGSAGSRMVIALVSSEFAAGQTADLEARMHWRLNVIHRGALLTVGGDTFNRQMVGPLKRLLASRLTPIVTRIMTEEAAQGLVGRVPSVGLSVCGVAVEWLTQKPAADNTLQFLVSVLLQDCHLDNSAHKANTTAALSWQGRLLAATPAWTKLHSIDQALLLSLAQQVGPAVFEEVGRSWFFEELENLWVPIAGSACGCTARVGHGNPDGSLSTALGMQLNHETSFGAPSNSPSDMVSHRHRMVNVRLHIAPNVDTEGIAASMCTSCQASACNQEAWAVHNQGTLAGCMINEDTDLPFSLRMRPLLTEASDIRNEEFSIVLSLLVDEEEEEETVNEWKSALENVSKKLQQRAELYGTALEAVWFSLSDDSSSFISSIDAELVAIMLLDELSQDATMYPSPWHSCVTLPWQCCERRRRAAVVRRLIYWIHALPRLTSKRSQQFVCTQDFTIAAVRRDDGVQCWVFMESNLCPEDMTSLGPTTGMAPSLESHSSESAERKNANGVLHIAASVLARVSMPADLRTIFGPDWNPTL